MSNSKKGSEEMERLYEIYFNQEDSLGREDESTSLLQPSPSVYVESFTTYEITDDLLVHKGN